MSDHLQLPERGKTYLKGPNRTPGATAGTSAGLEGQKKLFVDNDFSQRGMKVPRTGREVTCILVKNVSGIALLPKRLCVWKAGYEGKRVDGYVTTDFAKAAGVVDDWLPAGGVSDDDLFWLVVQGPCLVKNDIAAAATAHINAGDYLVALTAASSQATTSGRIQSYVATSNQTNIATQLLNKIGYALSAKTSANTNADVLAEIRLAA